MLLQALKEALLSTVRRDELSTVMDYALLPAGKLFRPRLVEALVPTLSKNALHLASAIELHHAYTLVHDDLPAMDNDLTRRGKASTHVHFGQWKAILAGDALLISSFHELMKIDHKNLKKIQVLFSWATGAKGLIGGQFLDLASDNKLTFENIIRIHELKTARLIQVASLGSLYLNTENPNLRQTVDYFKLGREIGLTFQLLDDLSDFLDHDKDAHEENINPYFSFADRAFEEMTHSHERLQTLIRRYRLTQLNVMLNAFFSVTKKDLLKHPHLPENFRDWITSFSSL